VSKKLGKKVTGFIRSRWDYLIHAYRILAERDALARQLKELRKHHENVVAEHRRLLTLAQAQAVRLMFRMTFDREPSLDEESYYSGRLDAGESCDVLLKELAKSLEGRAGEAKDKVSLHHLQARPDHGSTT
jgi:hypothetical protein